MTNRVLVGVFLFGWGLAAQAQSLSLSLGAGPCAGFVAQFKEGSEHAYLLTAGHCLPGLYDDKNPNQTLRNVSVRSFLGGRYSPHRVSTGETSVTLVWPKDIVFASFQGADVAVLSLQETVTDLRAAGLTPLLVDFSLPAPGTSVMVAETLFLDQAKCEIEALPPLLRYRVWNWPHTARLSQRCVLERGWSGAQVVNATSGRVIGLISGANENGQCDDYCEIDSLGGGKAFRNQSYLTRLDFLADCVDSTGALQGEQCQP